MKNRTMQRASIGGGDTGPAGPAMSNAVLKKNRKGTPVKQVLVLRLFAGEQVSLPHELCDLAGDGTGVASAQCLFDDLLGVVAFLGGEAGANHGFVGAGLALGC